MVDAFTKTFSWLARPASGRSSCSEFFHKQGTFPSRGTGDLGSTNTNVSNFTFVFGCDPAAGVAADTKFVKLFIEHLKSLFSPEDGSVLIPDCLGTIDSFKENVSFESTSSNLGRTLQLFRQDNRVGTKHLIVLTQDKYVSKNGKDADEDDPDDEKILVIQKPKNFQEAYLNCSKKT